jgi:hypothetical protein
MKGSFEADGYLTGFNVKGSELKQIKFWIRERWLNVLTTAYPALKEQVNQTSLSNYHTLSSQIEHENLWSKTVRLFSPQQVKSLMQMSLFTQLKSKFGPYKIADIEGLGYPEVYWRMVRPNESNDVSGVHSDRWFYTYTNNISDARQERLLKFWLAIEAIPNESGLSVVCGSHLKKWPNGSELRHGRPKPVFLGDSSSLIFQKLSLQPSEGVLFSIDLLHKGISHFGNHTRFSIEFALEEDG